jgi:hypothetical protein
MTIHIPISYLDPQIKKLYLEGKLIDISVDYACNALMSFHDEKEIIVYSFDKYLRLDNRLKGHTLFKHKTEIVLCF